ncbi:hypothetical protein Y1Q_0007152 [Alligator mississippiensis]|uniref:Uncharacterized protein n=1 Tax=Alligator mississippiensis TaxID=8496 RepID=A0A151N5X2_ALLMI|nr:hypothetical protein Y1Q_0007152 [Alligator mississippiensis]
MLHLIFNVPILSAALPDDQLLKHCLSFNAFFTLLLFFDLSQCSGTILQNGAAVQTQLLKWFKTYEVDYEDRTEFRNRAVTSARIPILSSKAISN